MGKVTVSVSADNEVDELRVTELDNVGVLEALSDAVEEKVGIEAVVVSEALEDNVAKEAEGDWELVVDSVSVSVSETVGGMDFVRDSSAERVAAKDLLGVAVHSRRSLPLSYSLVTCPELLPRISYRILNSSSMPTKLSVLPAVAAVPWDVCFLPRNRVMSPIPPSVIPDCVVRTPLRNNSMRSASDR